MVTPACPKCHRTIPADDVNVAQGIAYCRACNLAHDLALLVHDPVAAQEIDFAKPPPGAWCHGSGLGTEVGAHHRSWPGAIALLFFGVFWNGIVSVFVLLALGATLRHLHVPIPDWFPAPDMNKNEIGVGMTIFLWIFLTPFIAVGLALVAGFLSSIAGRTVITLRNGRGHVRVGMGPLVWSRKFEAEAVTGVQIKNQRWRDSEGDRHQRSSIVITLTDGKTLSFGSMLREDRMRYVAAALRQLLVR